tara:strand:- start:1000 stop:1512 length:513 start_codon:yes stop_codon:yes gene_type:complete
MPTGTIEDIFARAAVPIYYDSKINKLIFEIFNLSDLSPGGPFFSYIDGYESQQEPLSNIQIHIINQAQAQDYISFTENRNFQISEVDVFGYLISSSRYTSEFMDIISSGVNDYIPPRVQKTLVYDFKFIKNSGNYVFFESESIDTGAPEDSAADSASTSSTETSGGGYAY